MIPRTIYSIGHARLLAEFLETLAEADMRTLVDV